MVTGEFFSTKVAAPRFCRPCAPATAICASTLGSQLTPSFRCNPHRPGDNGPLYGGQSRAQRDGPLGPRSGTHVLGTRLAFQH